MSEEPDEAGDEEEGRPATPPAPRPARKPIGLEEMSWVCLGEAQRIRATQAALVAQKLRPTADPGKLREAEVFENVARMIEQMRPNIDAHRQLIRGNGARRR